MFPKYPQHVFFKFVKRHVISNLHQTIVDCPCGEGYISYHIAEQFPGSQVRGIDIDEGFIRNAQGYRLNNLAFEQADIHTFLENCQPFDLYLLINSIFLLPRPEEILREIHDKLNANGRLIVVIPNVASINFKNFQKMEPELNKLILGREEAAGYFQQYGFNVEKTEGAAYVPYIGNRLLNRLWKFKGLYIYLFDSINKMLGRKPCYWGFVLSKK